MEILFNAQKEEAQIENCFNLAIKAIERNLSDGKRITEFYFPIEIGKKVKKKIDKELEGKPFVWLVMYRGKNQYGKVVDFISQTIGKDKHYKLNYFGD